MVDLDGEILQPQCRQLDGLRLQTRRILRDTPAGAKNPIEVRVGLVRRNELPRLRVPLSQLDERLPLSESSLMSRQASRSRFTAPAGGPGAARFDG